LFDGKVIICDDEEEMRRYLKRILEAFGLRTEDHRGGEELLRQLKAGCDADLLLLDLRMPGVDGIELLREVRKLAPALPVVMMSAYGTIDTAVQAMKLGAYDYITKPFPKEKVLGVLEKVLERKVLIKENCVLKEELSRQSAPGNVVVCSSRFREAYEMALEVAKSDANVLIQGESGTGKELIARALHVHSPRHGRRFLSINCAALTETLLESEMFGHVRGAFTGAVATKKGLVEEADGGTLFMDEIGDMNLPLQSKLLRVIQEREFMPVGGTKSRSVDIRLVAASNKNLSREVTEGRFRGDLFYRLNVITIALPSLRERKEDIEPLARHFMRGFARRLGKEMKGIDEAALKTLTAYDWPGNVRELQNVMERAVILAKGDRITAELLPLWRDGAPVARHYEVTSLEQVERDHIERVLQRTGYHKSRTAQLLGVCRRTLDRKMAEYNLSAPALHRAFPQPGR
jgi:DNA-binding NtrC family response regulator